MVSLLHNLDAKDKVKTPLVIPVGHSPMGNQKISKLQRQLA
jgi:hypothetical protein